MKREIYCFVAVCALVSGVYGGYYELNDGEYGYGLRLENNDVLVFNGGGADAIDAYDASQIKVLTTSSPLGLDVGGIYALDLNDMALLHFSAGELGSIRLQENATAVLLGGRIDYITSYQYILQPDDKILRHIEIVCDLDSVFHDSQTNILTGNWLDGSSFEIQLVDVDGYDPVIDNMFFTPEPASLMLLGLGVLFVRNRKRV